MYIAQGDHSHRALVPFVIPAPGRRRIAAWRPARTSVPGNFPRHHAPFRGNLSFSVTYACQTVFLPPGDASNYRSRPFPPFAHAGEVLESTACNRFPILCRKLTGHAKAENPQGNEEAIPTVGIRQGQAPAFGYQSPGIRHVEEAKAKPAWNDQCRQDSIEIDSPGAQWQQQLRSRERVFTPRGLATLPQSGRALMWLRKAD